MWSGNHFISFQRPSFFIGKVRKKPLCMKVNEMSCYNEGEALTQSLTLSNSSLGEKNRMVKKPPAKKGDIRDTSSIPGWGRFPGGGHGNPLQYSCLENPMDRGTWWTTVHGVTKSWTGLKWLSKHVYTGWYNSPESGRSYHSLGLGGIIINCQEEPISGRQLPKM